VLYGIQRIERLGRAARLRERQQRRVHVEKVSHLNLKRVIRYAPSSWSGRSAQIHVTTKDPRAGEGTQSERKPILFVFDSLTVPPCERELKENNLPLDYSVADWKKIVGRQEQPGERAKVISSEMRKLQAMVRRQDVTVYLINQIRDKIGVMYGSRQRRPRAATRSSSTPRCVSAREQEEDRAREAGEVLWHQHAGQEHQEPDVPPVRGGRRREAVLRRRHRPDQRPAHGPDRERAASSHEGRRQLLVADGLPAELNPAEYKFKAAKCRQPSVRSKCCWTTRSWWTRNCSEDLFKLFYLDCWASGLLATESGDYTEKFVSFDGDGN
jgi:hypothetical protein